MNLFKKLAAGAFALAMIAGTPAQAADWKPSGPVTLWVAFGAGGSTDTIPASVDEVWNQPYLFKIDVGNVRGITTISSIEAVFLP